MQLARLSCVLAVLVGVAHAQTEIVVDNSNAGYSETGFWVTGTFSSGYYGPNYDHNNGCSSCSDTATWTYTAPAAGAYSVYAWWPATSNRATNAAYTVNSASGATPVVVNQQINGGQWNLLGTFTLNQGTNTVTLSAQGNGSVVADAIRVVSPAFAVSVNPIADAFASSAFPNISFGGGNTISLWNTPQVWGYLKFDVQTLPANATTVTLRLRGSGSTTTTVNAYAVTDTTWGETTITWNNKPSTGATPIASASVGTTDQWYSWDITAYVQSERAAGHNLISLALKTTSGGSGQSWLFSSREGANPPELTAQALAPLAALYSMQVDHLNTPRAVYDANQQVRWKWDQLEPFGENAPDENPSGLGPFEFPLQFEGTYRDRETSLLQNHYRELDPVRGQYLQGDPIGLRGGPNPYLHVRANPLRWKDPSGLLIVSSDCGAIAAAIQAAEQEVRNRLNASCGGCTDRNTACIPCKYLTPLRNAVQTSRVTCRATDKLPLVCASGSVGGGNIYLYPASTSPLCGGAACLGATLLHELLHNIGLSVAAHPEIDFIERRCFSCGGFPTGAPPFVPPSNDPFY